MLSGIRERIFAIELLYVYLAYINIRCIFTLFDPTQCGGLVLNEGQRLWIAPIELFCQGKWYFHIAYFL